MKRTSSLLMLLVLAALAFLTNWYAPTIFFDMQLMLGGSWAVLAILQFGWSGLWVGWSALIVTYLRWGHPFELILGSFFLIWLIIFIRRFNGGLERRDNGRIVLAAIGFWLLVGLPAEYAYFRLANDTAPFTALGLGLKESVVGIANTTLGLLFFLCWRWRAVRRGEATIPVRGATFVTVLLSITLPAILISLIYSENLRATKIESFYWIMSQRGVEWALRGYDDGDKLSRTDPYAFQLLRADGSVTRSDEALIRRLEENYERQEANRGRHLGLDLYVPRAKLPVLRADQISYWAVTDDYRHLQSDQLQGLLTVYQPAQSLVALLDYELLLPSFIILFMLLLLGALISEGLSSIVDRQFQAVLHPATGTDLAPSRIRELDQLVGLINERTRQVEDLNENLHQLERTAYELTENIPIGTYTMVQPADGGLAYFSFMSKRFLEITGLDREEARSHPFKAFECVHPDDRDEWVRKNVEAFEKGAAFDEECRLVIKGDVRWCRAESTPRQLRDGTVVWEGVIYDITEQRLAELKLAASEASLRRILEHLPLPLAIVNPAIGGTITFLNEAFTRTFGYTHADIPDIAAWAKQAFPETTYRAESFTVWDAAVIGAGQEDGIVPPMEFRLTAKTGISRNVIISAVLLDDALVAGFVDITDLLKAEEELANANRNMRIAAEAAQLGFWMYDVETGLDIWDENMCRIHGITLAEFDGNWKRFVHPDDLPLIESAGVETLVKDQFFDFEFRIVRADGQTRHIREYGVVIRDSQDKPLRVHGAMLDVTKEKIAADRERQLAAFYRSKLEDKLKSSLAAAAVGHEINTPLSTLLLQSKQSLGKGGANREELEIIVREAQHVLRIIEKMKVLMRNVQTDHEPINLQDVVDSSLLQVKRLLDSRDISVQRRGNPHEELMVDGDDAQIQMALTNILRNAIEAITASADDHSREILIQLNRVEDRVQISIGDSGPGFDEVNKEALLLNTTKEGGTGIGLYIVQTMAQNHDAELTFGSSPLGGAQVTLSFPALN